jgi:hypothetical protein
MITQQMAGRLLKAVYSAAVSFLGALSTILVGSATFADVTEGQWTTITLTALLAFGGTFGLSTWAGPTHGTSSSSSSG